MVSNDILLKPNLVIIDEMGRSWVVKARPISRGRFSLTSGWGAFFIANSLTIDDECTFEFVLDSNNLCGELKVKITRSLEITQQEKQKTIVQEG